MVIEKADGCDWMLCGDKSHGNFCSFYLSLKTTLVLKTGSLANCIKFGGCGCAFQWNSLTIAQDPCGIYDVSHPPFQHIH